jgi:hypothetical protein
MGSKQGVGSEEAQWPYGNFSNFVSFKIGDGFIFCMIIDAEKLLSRIIHRTLLNSWPWCWVTWIPLALLYMEFEFL